MRIEHEVFTEAAPHHNQPVLLEIGGCGAVYPVVHGLYCLDLKPRARETNLIHQGGPLLLPAQMGASGSGQLCGLLCDGLALPRPVRAAPTTKSYTHHQLHRACDQVVHDVPLKDNICTERSGTLIMG